MHKRYRYLSAALVVCLSVLLALLAGGVISPRTAHAATQVSIFRHHGMVAEANFDSFDATTCIETSVLLEGDQENDLTPPSGGPQQPPHFGLIIGQFNNCTFTEVLNVAFFTSLPVFTVHMSDLSSATVTASIATENLVTGDPLNLDVTMTWDGTGSTMRNVNQFHSNAGGVVFNEIGVSFMRDAVATGTITDGTTNFTPTPSSSASLQTLTSGEITVTMG